MLGLAELHRGLDPHVLVRDRREAPAVAGDRVRGAAGDLQRRLHHRGVADRPHHVRGVDPGAVDLEPPVLAGGDGGRGDHPHVPDLDHLRTGVAQLLDDAQQGGGAHAPLRIGDRDDDAAAMGRCGPGEDLEVLQAVLRGVLRRDVVLLAGAQRLQRALELRVLDLEVRAVPAGLVQQPHQLLLAGALERVLAAAHLGGDRQAQQQAQQPHDHLGERGLRPQGVAQAPPDQPLLLRRGGGTGAVAHDRKSRRLIAAALEKMRIPRTTITAVESWEPTPSWSPRNTRKAAISTLNRNEVMNTCESKAPSRLARRPPARGSSAATTAMGRYGGSSAGTSGWTTTPSTRPSTRPLTAITGSPPRRPGPRRSAAWPAAGTARRRTPLDRAGTESSSACSQERRMPKRVEISRRSSPDSDSSNAACSVPGAPSAVIRYGGDSGRKSTSTAEPAVRIAVVGPMRWPF